MNNMFDIVTIVVIFVGHLIVGHLIGVEAEIAVGIAGIALMVVTGFEITWKKIDAINKTYEKETK